MNCDYDISVHIDCISFNCFSGLDSVSNHLQGMKGPPGMDGEKGVPGIAGPRVCTFSVYKPQIRPGKKKTISLKFIEFIMAENLHIFVLPPLLTNMHP